MDVGRLLLVPCAALGLAVLAAVAPAAQLPRRTMAITIDDLPYLAGAGAPYLAQAERGTRAILRVLAAHRAPAVGFVNEGKMWAAPAERERRIALLKLWADAGVTLGNHTYSHPDLNRVSIETFQREIATGEPITLRVMAGRGPYQRYFRHPMTHTGETALKKQAIERFLAARGYAIAPHTIENSDFLFDPEYAASLARDDIARASAIGRLYVDHTLAATAFAERMSVEIFGRDIPQTLLIHANGINAAYLDELLRAFASRGYRFITLDEAMADATYKTPDAYVGTYGPTWLLRWAKTLKPGLSFADDPKMPALPK